MAGPGGGPPRKSHTKSRKGCESCKRRHIRCDENFPQCRNCTKHKVRCPYNDSPVSDDRSSSPDQPNLLWTPEIEATITLWQRTGVFPFPGLNIYPAPAPQYLTVENLRLIHHVASISDQLAHVNANGFTLWTRQIPTLIQIGALHGYVMHALLAFSAMHIAYLTDCPLVGSMAYEHRGLAFKGLQEAIGSFSKDTSDAILAASLLLSWQATEWRSWEKLMQGTTAVIGAMESWKHESQFGSFIAESSTFPTGPTSPKPERPSDAPQGEDLAAFQHTLQQLHKVEIFLKQNGEDAKSITQLMTFFKGSRKVSQTLSVSQQFERLRPLRTWLFWVPVMHLQQTNGSISALVTIAHYYTVALIMERLFPDIGTAYFGSLSIGPVEDIARRLFAAADHTANGAHSPLQLMEFPINTVNEFRSRMGWAHPNRTASFPQFGQPSPSVKGELASASTPPSSQDYLPYGPNPAFNYSTEDLAVFTGSPSQMNAPSPLANQSPFTNQQYLNIPSPSFGGWSPASSTYGDFGEASSIVYSDAEDFASLDLGVPGNSFSCKTEFNFNTPPQILSTTPTYSPIDSSLFIPGSVSKWYAEDFLHPSHPMERHHSTSPAPVMLTPNYHYHHHHRHNLSTASAPPTF